MQWATTKFREAQIYSMHSSEPESINLVVEQMKQVLSIPLVGILLAVTILILELVLKKTLLRRQH